MNDLIPEKIATVTVAPKTHSFSLKLASRYGYKAAIIMGYLANRINATNNKRDGHKWFFVTIEALGQVYPYLSETCIAEVLDKQVDKNQSILRDEFNLMPGDRTWWYAFAKEEDFDEALKPTKPIYFVAEHAECFGGVVPAVLISNMAYWFEKDGTDKPCRMSATRLATRLPFSRDQILRALDGLFWDKVIRPVRGNGQDKASSYLPGEKWPGKVHANQQGPHVVKAGLHVVKAEMPDAKAGIHVVNPDNNTYWKHIPNPSSETHFTPRPAEPSSASTALPLTGSAEQLQSHQDGSPHDQATDEALLSKEQINTSPDHTSASSNEDVVVPLNLGISSFAELTALNQKHAHYLELNQNGFDQLIHAVVTEFITATQPKELYRWSYLQDEQEMFNAMLLPFCSRRFEALLQFRDNELTEPLFSRFALERLVVGCYKLRHPNAMCTNWSYNASIEFTRALKAYEAEMLAQWIHQQLSQRGAQFASPDAALETRASLSSYEKVRVFKNSITARNQVGAFTKSGKLVQPVVQMHDGLLKPLNKLFTDNPLLTVAHLNSVLDGCVEVWLGPPVREERDPFFYSRKAESLSFFLKHLDKIIGELAIPNLPAITVGLPDLNQPEPQEMPE